MAAIKSHGLILKKTAYSESSLILKVFTRESGLITLIAKGAKNPKSKLRGLLDFFTLNQFVYPEKSKSEMLTLLDVSLVQDFPHLKVDPKKQSLSNVFLEVYTKYMHEPAPSPPHFELLLEGLSQIEDAHPKTWEPSLHACDFLLGLCAVSGFSPQFLECVICGSEEMGLRVLLDSDFGGPICSTCISQKSHVNTSQVFSTRIIKWLDKVQLLGIHAGRISKEDFQQCENFLLDFLGKHAGGSRPIKSLNFYRSMLNGL